MAFPGTITLRPQTMIAAMEDWAASLTRHGFERIYWLNGHGGNINTINAAFSQMYHAISFGGGEGSNRPPLRCTLRNWWELSGATPRRPKSRSPISVIPRRRSAWR